MEKYDKHLADFFQFFPYLCKYRLVSIKLIQEFTDRKVYRREKQEK
jgi:DNA polymerase sigma